MSIPPNMKLRALEAERALLYRRLGDEPQLPRWDPNFYARDRARNEMWGGIDSIERQIYALTGEPPGQLEEAQ